MVRYRQCLDCATLTTGRRCAARRRSNNSTARGYGAGHRVTARDQYLRAAAYLAEPLFFVLGSSTPAREPEVFSTLREYWEKAGGRFDPKIEKVAIPADRIALTGWSMGGILTSRAAAFEPRLRALVTDPGGVNAWLAFPSVIRDAAKAGDRKQLNDLWNNEIVYDFLDDAVR